MRHCGLPHFSFPPPPPTQVGKGSRVNVTGRLRIDNYVDREQNPQMAVVIEAEEVSGS